MIAKYMEHNGNVRWFDCSNIVSDWSNNIEPGLPPSVTFTATGGNGDCDNRLEFVLEKNDIVYIMNNDGKTVDTIRTH